MNQEQHLLQLVYAKQNTELQQIKKRFSDYSKYFFNLKRNITIVYDKNIIYVIHKDYLKLIDLGKAYVITDLAYNYQKNVLFFCTVEGGLFVYFPSIKSLIPIKKDYKHIYIIDWIFGSSQVAHLFVAEQGGVHLYRFEQEKKTFKETKHLSGKYHCFLYQPLSEILIGFPYGDCELANIFHFDPSKSKNWFKSGEVEVSFQKDETLLQRIKKTKSFGLEGSRVGKQIFGKKSTNQDYFIDCFRICNTTYVCFYTASEGKLILTPISEQNSQKLVTIKLPSDSLPLFNIVDNMLVVHLKNQKITFIYDIGSTSFQTLVSPYPLCHQHHTISSKIYNGEFVGKRVILPQGIVSKWKINLSVIFHFLKNQMLVFQFLNKRSCSKMEIIRWLRQNLFNLKPINLSKIWKHIFIKAEQGNYDQSEMVTIVQLYSNLFYTLSIDALISKQALTTILIECLRQAHQFHIKIPDQLQYLTTDLLLSTKKYDILAYLCHHDVIKADQTIYKIIYAQSQKTGEQILTTLSIDLVSQCNLSKEMLKLLLKTQRIRQAKRYIKSNSQKFEVLDMLQAAKYIRNVEVRREFVKFVRGFILQKFPSMNTIYLDEAQKKLFS